MIKVTIEKEDKNSWSWSATLVDTEIISIGLKSEEGAKRSARNWLFKAHEQLEDFCCCERCGYNDIKFEVVK